MKPVNLSPGVGVKSPNEPGSGSAVAAILVGGVAVLALAAYFMLAEVNTLKEQTTQVTARTQEATTEAQTISAQIAEAGQKKDWSETAVGFRKEVVGKLGERVNFASFSAELDNIRPAGVWLTAVQADTTSGQGVQLDGYAPSVEAVAAMVARINATKGMEDARIKDVGFEKSVSNRRFVKFEITATIVGAVATDALGGSAPLVDPNAQTVADSGAGAGESSLALEPEPGFNRKSSKASARKAKSGKATKTASPGAAASQPPKPAAGGLGSMAADAKSFGGTS